MKGRVRHMTISRREALYAGTVIAGASLTVPSLSPTAAEAAPTTAPDSGRVRARALGVAPGVFPTGRHNAITDVSGVGVGQVTLVRGDNVRTGVTAIRPHPGNVFQDKVPGAVHIGNAFGKLAGSTQVEELGTIETPIILTNTLGVGRAVDAVVGWAVGQDGNENVRSVNALVGETNDGTLNDIRGRHVSADDVVRAIESATGGPVTEGAVGAGTGTVAFGWKGGIGTSSRLLPQRYGGYTVGVLVQANYGGLLTVDGVPVGLELGHNPYAEPARAESTPDGSCMIVVATDAPLSDRNLRRLAARAVFGLGRTGSSYSNGSGDYAIAFSAAPGLRVRHGDQRPREHALLPNDAVSPLFQAALEATEEAVYNALFMATTTTGNGTTIEAIPLNEVRRLLRKYGRGE
jgi:D-aminopeptidase